MAKISFYLKEPNVKTKTVLFAFVYINRATKFKISTGNNFHLHPDFWSASKQMVKKSHPQSIDLNERLKQIKSEYENICLKAEIKGVSITKEYLQNNSRFASNSTDVNSVLDVYDRFVNAKRNHCAKNSILKYQSIKNHLVNFCATTGYNLSFQSLDFRFHEKFTHYLLHEAGMFNHSVSKTIKFLKTFLNYAFENDFHENVNYKKWKPLNDNSSEIIALSIDELRSIEDLKDLPGHIEKARNLFLILCYSGLRFSDLKNVNGNNIKNGFLHITTQKTKDAIKVPVHNKLINLLERFTVNNEIQIEQISNQKMNVYLKEIGKKAELKEKCFKVRYKGGKAVEIEKRKWELLTTHTGRRTFTTLSLYLGMDSESVKKITGHKSDASFKKYVRYSDQQLKDKISVWN